MAQGKAVLSEPAVTLGDENGGGAALGLGV